MTLGGVLRTHMQLIAWCHACLHQVEPDIAALVERYGRDGSAGMGRPADLLEQGRDSSAQFVRPICQPGPDGAN